MYRVLDHDGQIRLFDVGSKDELPEDVAGLPCYKDTGNSPFENTGLWSGRTGICGEAQLYDCRHERRFVQPPGGGNRGDEALKIAIRFHDWLDYDNQRTFREMAKLREENITLITKVDTKNKRIDELYLIISQIYDINENGGHGSRKKVRDLLTSEIEICDGCGRAACQCKVY